MNSHHFADFCLDHPKSSCHNCIHQELFHKRLEPIFFAANYSVRILDLVRAISEHTRIMIELIKKKLEKLQFSIFTSIRAKVIKSGRSGTPNDPM